LQKSILHELNSEN